MGGNIGLPILAQEPLPEGGVYVLELSSYQIDLTQSLDCDVAVLLNITPDHLDRYDGFEAYARVQGAPVRDAVARSTGADRRSDEPRTTDRQSLDELHERADPRAPGADGSAGHGIARFG